MKEEIKGSIVPNINIIFINILGRGDNDRGGNAISPSHPKHPGATDDGSLYCNPVP